VVPLSTLPSTCLRYFDGRQQNNKQLINTTDIKSEYFFIIYPLHDSIKNRHEYIYILSCVWVTYKTGFGLVDRIYCILYTFTHFGTTGNTAL
jgi:hypothetical protein